MDLYCGKEIECPNRIDFLYKKNHVNRAGIIPYLIDKEKEKFILLGIDKRSGVYADLGGTTEKGETALETAIREFLEESRSVISVDLSKTTSIIFSKVSKKKKQVLLFAEVELSKYNVEIDKEFQERVPRNKYEDEMSRLIWINLQEFLNIPDNILSHSLQEAKKILKE